MLVNSSTGVLDSNEVNKYSFVQWGRNQFAGLNEQFTEKY